MNIAALQKLIGDGQVSNAIESRLAVGQDASGLRGDCLAVVWPDHVDQVCVLTKWARQEGIDLVPRGAGTGLCGGATPQESIVVDFSRMNAIGSLDVESRRIHVKAGVVLDTVNRILAPSSLCLPVVPSSHMAATVGGMIATNASGLRAVCYGSMRNWIEAVTLVDGAGQIHRLRGEALNDVAGREGASGFIVEAELRLTELPRQPSLSLQAFEGTAALLEQRARWLEDRRLTAMEYLNRWAAQAIGWTSGPYLLAEFEEGAGEIHEPMRMAELWCRRDSLGPQLTQQGLSLSEDPLLESDALAALLDWLEAEHIPAFGHLGVGIIHPRFRPGDERIAVLYQKVEDWGGRVSGEHGIGLKKKAWVSAAYQDEIRQLKSIYDPGKVLNRGKPC